MKQIRSSNIIFLYFTIAVTVFVLLVYVYVYYKTKVSTERTIIALSSAKAGSSNGNNNQNYLLDYKNSSSKWSRLPGFFIIPDKVVVFIEAIEALGTETGSKVTIVSIDADKLDGATPGKEGSLRVKVNATGSWSSVMRTLSLAEVMPYKISINNVRIDQYTAPSNDINAKRSSYANEWKLSLDIEAAMIVLAKNSQ